MEDTDAPDPKPISDTLGFAAILTAALAIFASGGLAVLAIAASVLCLAGSIAASLAGNRDSHCEGCRESEQAIISDQAGEPAFCESLHPAQVKCWTRAILEENSAGRGR